MNIAFFTNTYLPHVGGVARSVESVAAALRGQGHRVLIVAPEFADMPEEEAEVIRMPALQNFNASDFSVALPFPKGLTEKLREFGTDIIHSHHPFLLGTTAVRLARALQVPLVFTHHTLYEEYTHYMVPESSRIRTFISEIATGYANLTDRVIAPSESLRQLLRQRGVTVPIDVIPTGVDTRLFRPLDGASTRRQLGIGTDAFVVGHMGRLAPEKNVGFLARAACRFLHANEDARFLLVGDGPSKAEIEDIFRADGLQHRLVTTGTLSGEPLVNALNAMDVFAFTSRSETQGMVLTEAMATGMPVVILDASGVGDLVTDRWNGRKIAGDSMTDFCGGLQWVRDLPAAEREDVREHALQCAAEYSLSNTTARLAAVYQRAGSNADPDHDTETPLGLEPLMARLRVEWEILKKISHASDEAFSSRAP